MAQTNTVQALSAAAALAAGFALLLSPVAPMQLLYLFQTALIPLIVTAKVGAVEPISGLYSLTIRKKNKEKGLSIGQSQSRSGTHLMDSPDDLGFSTHLKVKESPLSVRILSCRRGRKETRDPIRYRKAKAIDLLKTTFAIP